MRAIVAGVVFALILLGVHAAPASALLDPNHVVITEGGNDLTTEAQTWMKEYDGVRESEWTTHTTPTKAATDQRTLRQSMLRSKFLPAMGRILPYAAAALTAYEVCDAFIEAGCWLFERQDTPAVSGWARGWMETAGETGCFVGVCSVDLEVDRVQGTTAASWMWVRPVEAGTSWLAYAQWGGVGTESEWDPCAYGPSGAPVDPTTALPFTRMMVETIPQAFCGAELGEFSRSMVAYQLDRLTTEPGPLQEGRARLTPQADDPAIPNFACSNTNCHVPANVNWSQDMAAELQHPHNENVVEWIAYELEPETEPNPYLEPIPEPLPGEVYTAYITRLQELGLMGAVAVEVTAEQADATKASFEVLRVTPEPGTQVDPAADPATTITVKHNPDLGEGEGAGGSWSAPPVSGIDLSPLDVPMGCNKFPFGIFCWMYDGLGAWNSADSCPSWDLPISSSELTVNTCGFEPAMAIVRPVFLILVVFSLTWLLASSAMGLGAPNND